MSKLVNDNLKTTINNALLKNDGYIAPIPSPLTTNVTIDIAMNEAVNVTQEFLKIAVKGLVFDRVFSEEDPNVEEKVNLPFHDDTKTQQL